MYQIGFDRERNLLRVARLGFPTLEDVSKYEVDLQAAVDHMARSGSFTMLLDITLGPPLSQEASERMGRIIDLLMRKGCRRLAIVSSSAVIKLQLRRLTNAGLPSELFATEAEALDWLGRPS